MHKSMLAFRVVNIYTYRTVQLHRNMFGRINQSHIEYGDEQDYSNESIH